MSAGMKVCKVCGAEYQACKANRLVEGVFRWKDVACCPEHGQEYLRRVLIARGELTEDTTPVRPTTAKTKATASKKKTETEETVVVDPAEVVEEVKDITEEY